MEWAVVSVSSFNFFGVPLEHWRIRGPGVDVIYPNSVLTIVEGHGPDQVSAGPLGSVVGGHVVVPKETGNG